ncbi:MAG: hypothetical protein J6B95_02385 [Oscillospiraceae bacterium]|nr:hypothetical protein [Oscillospiraceae bacterium]
MYKDHNKELERLESELLRAEANDDEFAALCHELCDESDADNSFENEDYDPQWDIEPSEPETQRYQTGWETDFGGRLEDEQTPKEKGVRGLVVCACLECLAIAAVMLWWVFRIL